MLHRSFANCVQRRAMTAWFASSQLCCALNSQTRLLLSVVQSELSNPRRLTATVQLWHSILRAVPDHRGGLAGSRSTACLPLLVSALQVSCDSRCLVI